MMHHKRNLPFLWRHMTYVVKAKEITDGKEKPKVESFSFGISDGSEKKKVEDISLISFTET